MSHVRSQDGTTIAYERSGSGPPLALVHVLVQAKGFGYHFHPLTAATSLAWLAIVAMLWHRHRFARTGVRRGSGQERFPGRVGSRPKPAMHNLPLHLWPDPYES